MILVAIRAWEPSATATSRAAVPVPPSTIVPPVPVTVANPVERKSRPAVVSTLPETVTTTPRPPNTGLAPGTSGMASDASVTAPRQARPAVVQVPEPPATPSLPVQERVVGTPAVGATPNCCWSICTSPSSITPSASRSYVQVSAPAGMATEARSTPRSVSLRAASLTKFTRRNFTPERAEAAAVLAVPVSRPSSCSRSRVSTRPSPVTSAAALNSAFFENRIRSKP